MKRTAIVLLVLAAFLAVRAEECVNQVLIPGQKFVLEKSATVDQIAQRIGVSAEVFARCNKIGNEWVEVDSIVCNAGDTLMVPPEAPMPVSKPVAAVKKVATIIRHSKLPYCIRTDNGEVPERNPFIRADYLRCTYTVTATDVKQGMTLAKLANGFPNTPALRLSCFDALPANSRLFAGQLIDIPNWDFSYWYKVNVAPVGKRTPGELRNVVWPKLRFFQQHPGLINDLEAKYALGNFTRSSIISGERCDQWLSGKNCIVADNGVAAFSADTSVGAELFTIDVTGENKTAYIKMADACYNWTIKVVSKNTTPVVPTPVVPPTPFEPPAVPVPNPPTDTTPPVTTPDTGAKPPVTVNWQNVPSVSTGFWKNRFLVYGDDFRPAYNSARQGAQSYGFRWDCLKEYSPSRNSFGFTLQGNGWDGESRSGFTYDGFSLNAGPMLILSLSPSVYWGIDLSTGGQWNWNHGVPSYDLEAFQTNVFGHAGSSFDAFWTYVHLSLWCGYDLAATDPTPISGTNLKLAARDSRVGNTPFLLSEDPPIDNSGFNFGTRVYLGTDSAVVKPCIAYRYAYSASDNSQTNAIGAGVSFFREGLTIEGLLKNKSGSKYGEDCDGNGFEMMLTIAFGSGRSWFSKSSAAAIERNLEKW
jgi:hypothetical protein